MKKALAAFGILLICLVAFLWFQGKTLFPLTMDGLMYPGDGIKTSLINGDSSVSYSAVPVVDGDEILVRNAEYYVDGDDGQRRVAIDLPLVSTDGARVMTLTSVDAITENFATNTTFRGAVFVEGELYNIADNEQVDRDKYTFIKTKDGLFVNLQEIKVTTLMGEKTIPVNSLIMFERNEIRYYTRGENNWYRYMVIEGVDLTNEIMINGAWYSYEDFLARMGIWEAVSEEEASDEDEDGGDDNGIEGDRRPDYSGLFSNQNTGGNNAEIIIPEREQMEVSAKYVNVDTYAATFDVVVVDPRQAITRYPTIEIKRGDEVYARKTWYATGTFEIAGLLPDTGYSYTIYFIYRNEENKLIQETLATGEFTTLGMTGVEPVDFTYTDIVAYATYAELNNFNLGNKASDKVLRGLNKVTIEIDGNDYTFSTGAVSRLKRLEAFKYTTPSVMNSNSTYHVTLNAYDVAGNKLEVRNNEFDVKTSKLPPTAKILVRSVDFTSFEALVRLTNNDNVNITNLRYVLINGNTIVREGLVDGTMEIKEDGLVDNKVYRLLIYADYDLDDGQGNRVNQLLDEVNISTTSMAVLGDLRLSLTKKALTKDSATFSVQVNARTTDARLVAMLQTLQLYLTNESGDVVQMLDIVGDELSALKSYEMIEVSFAGLNSKTEYYLGASSAVRQGDTDYDRNVILSVQSFMTMKAPAEVLMINQFTTSSIIDFDVKVEDVDGAIMSDRVIMEVREAGGALVGFEFLEVNGEYKRFTYNKLNDNTDYTISFIAEDYNEGYTDNTAEPSKIITSIVMTTTDSVSGTVSVESLLREMQGKNYYDIKNTQRWVSNVGNSTVNNRKYDLDESVTYLSAMNGSRTYAYYVPELAGETITVSFDAMYSVIGSGATAALVNGDGIEMVGVLSGLNGTRYKHISMTFKLNNRGYVGFYIAEAQKQNRLTTLAIKNLQIEKGDTETAYEPYDAGEGFTAEISSSVVDRYDDVDGKAYYVKLYHFDELIAEETQILENGSATNRINNFDVEEGTTYAVGIYVNVRGVTYEIATTEFTTEEEIRSLKTVDDFKNMHTTGKYIVEDDIDFRGITGALMQSFYGKIDFQGHKMILDTAGAPAGLFGSMYGTIQNVDMVVHMNNTSALNGWSGIAGANYGLIENVMITVEDTTDVANTGISLLTGTNNGIVRNFVVHLKASIYGVSGLSALVGNNNNIIRNGYVYGDEGVAINAIYESSPYYPAQKNTGAIAASQGSAGRVENVFSLVDVNTIERRVLDGSVEGVYHVGNLIGGMAGSSTLSHAYSNASGENRTQADDINVGGKLNKTGYNIDRLYYVANETYGDGTGSTRISPLMLRDLDFQTDTLNTYNGFDVKSFVTYGYYPHVLWPELMPNQEYLLLPVDKDADLVDIVTVLDVTQSDTSSATIKIKVNNPYNYEITGLKIQDLSNADNSNVAVVGQENENGMSIITVEVRDPVHYYSTYSVIEIMYEVTIGSISVERSRTYEVNEKIIYVDMYRTVSTVSDWVAIKSSSTALRENYILANNIDFSNQPSNNIQLGDYRGKLNGNGYAVKNMRITTGGSMIDNLYGKIENLYVENYTKSSVTDDSGVISRVQAGAQINGLHVRNVTLTSNLYLGGIAGRLLGGTIQNSTVSGLTLYDLSKSQGRMRVGGLVGGMTNSAVIQNSFAQNIDLDVRFVSNLYAIGGIAGEMSAGAIENVFATGTIRSRLPTNGGIVGLASGSGTVTRVYSDVDIITSSSINIGGIVGEVTTTNNTFKVSNTLSVGAIFSSSTENMVSRIIGSASISQPNYAWSDQHINGKISSTTTGETLLSTADLNLASTYTEIINFGNGFDYSEIGDNSLPLLYSTDWKTLLPDQEKVYLKTYTFNVDEIRIDPRATWAEVEFVIDNPAGFEIAEIVIDDATITEVDYNINRDGKTYYKVAVSPDYYFDSYMLSQISYYNASGTLETVSHDTRIEMQFFRQINSVEDWQAINPGSSENYLLTAEIDFSGVANVNHDLYINRLEAFENGFVIKNINISGDGLNVGLIHLINSSISKITFENISITNTSESAVSRTGVILYGYGKAENVYYKNITINAPNSNYVGMVADNYATTTRTISVENSTVTGKDDVGGYAGQMRSRPVNEVQIVNTTVNGTGNNVGGFIGNQWASGTVAQYDIVISGCNVSGVNNVGGAYGYGGASNITVNNGTTVTGVNNVGGITGQAAVSQSENEIWDSTVTGSGQNVGGISGAAGGISSAVVRGVTVTGNVNVGGVSGSGGSVTNTVVRDGTANTTVTGVSNVGGISGSGTGISGTMIDNVTVNGTGSYVGGMLGLANGTTISGSAGTNLTVTGLRNVGGIAGGANRASNNNNTITNSTINAVVTATEASAGGVVGYLDNEEDYIYKFFQRKVNSVIVENSKVKAPYDAGGIVGTLTTRIKDDGRIYSNLVVASVTTTDEDAEPGVLIGNDDSYIYDADGVLRGVKLYAYGGRMKSAGAQTTLANYTGNNFDGNNVLKFSDFTAISLYTSTIGLQNYTVTNSDFAQGFYPYPSVFGSNGLLSQLVRLKVPRNGVAAASVTDAEETMLITEQGTSYHALPSYTVYPSGVNVLNVEFSHADDVTKFTINGNEYPVNARVFSFNYNFDNRVEIVVSDGVSQNSTIYEPEDLRGHFVTMGDEFYVLDDGIVIKNGEKTEILANNIYNNQILTTDGRIINLETGEETLQSSTGIELIGDAVPLVRFNNYGKQIDTYASFSVVDSEHIVDKQILVKGAQTELIAGGLQNKKWQVMMDSYNSKDYLTILGNDGVLYDLKNKIVYPDNFADDGIAEISNNVKNITHLLAVRYANGKIVIFNYRNGEVMYKTQAKTVPTPLEYFISQVTNDNEEIYDKNRLEEGLRGAEALTAEIKNGTVVSEKVEVSAAGDYVATYDPVKNEYEIYEMNELLQMDPLGAMSLSVSDKIYGDNALNLLFGKYLENGRKENIVVVVVYVGIFVGITIAMIALGDLLRKKYSHFDKDGVK